MVQEKSRVPARRWWEQDASDLMEWAFGPHRRRMGWPDLPVPASDRWTPAVDVYEKEGKLMVECDLPGVDKNNIDVSIEDNTLVIQGERKEEKETKEANFYRSERAYGRFQRAIRVPEGTNPDDIQAEYKEGTLLVSVPLPEQERSGAKHIQVK